MEFIISPFTRRKVFLCSVPHSPARASMTSRLSGQFKLIEWMINGFLLSQIINNNFHGVGNISWVFKAFNCQRMDLECQCGKKWCQFEYIGYLLYPCRKFMLVKCINGEKATYNTSVFSTKRERTFQILLEDAMLQFGRWIWICSVRILKTWSFYREPNSKQTSTIVDTLESGVLQSYRWTSRILHNIYSINFYFKHISSMN